MKSPTTTQLNDISGTSSTNVVVVGDGGTILEYDGVEWEEVPSPTSEDLFGVWCASETDAFAVGDTGVVLRLTDGEWVVQPTPASQHLTRVHGSSSSNVWVVGQAAMLHFDGVEWSEDASFPEVMFSGIWVESDGMARAVGMDEIGGFVMELDGTTWSTSYSWERTMLWTIECTSHDNAFVSALTVDPLEPFMLHRCGSGW